MELAPHAQGYERPICHPGRRKKPLLMREEAAFVVLRDLSSFRNVLLPELAPGAVLSARIHR